MNLSDLHICALLAEERHFGRTAVRANMTQPAVSLALKRVEREYGVRLFDRGGGPVRLTAAGERMLPHIRGILDRAEILRDAAAVGEETLGTVVRVGYTPWGRPAVRSLVAAFHRHRPATTFRLVLGPAAQHRRRVAHGDLDVACVPARRPLPGQALPTFPAAQFHLSALAASRGARRRDSTILVPDLEDPELTERAAGHLAAAGLLTGPCVPVGSAEELVDRLVAAEGTALVDPRMIPSALRSAVSLRMLPGTAVSVPFELVPAVAFVPALTAVSLRGGLQDPVSAAEQSDDLTA